MSEKVDFVACACGDEYQVNSYGAGFMAANNGVCENCDAAQPAEAEGDRIANGFVILDGMAFSKGEILTQRVELCSALEALSAVTAERDRLAAEAKLLRGHAAPVRVLVAELDQLRAEGEALRAFANEIVSGAFEGGSFDGGDIQDIGVKHGLLRVEQRDEACDEFCACSEHGFPSECYRKTALLSAAMAAKEAGNE